MEDTSRSPRAGETDGKEYHFVSRNEFEKLIAEGKFIEYTQCNCVFLCLMTVSHNYYGTTIAAVEAIAQTGQRCILDIEMEVLVELRAS